MSKLDNVCTPELQAGIAEYKILAADTEALASFYAEVESRLAVDSQMCLLKEERDEINKGIAENRGPDYDTKNNQLQRAFSNVRKALFARAAEVRTQVVVGKPAIQRYLELQQLIFE